MFRTFKNNNKCNLTVFLVAIGLIICFVFYIVEFLLAFDVSWWFIVMTIQTIFFVLLFWVFLMVYFTQPGNAPTFWSVAPQWQEKTQQRRYCLICKHFKPQRAHHCSNCGKCILNMDHHCPWINNCVGFYNRKYFILFLVYLIVNLMFVLPQQIYLLVLEIIPIFKNEKNSNIHTFIRILLIIFQIGVLFPISTFLWYHLSLVLSNQTTLMQLKRQRDIQNNKQIDQFNPYDLGAYQNFIQVFGKIAWEWFLPIRGTLTCDGVKWRKIKRNHQLQLY